MVGKNYYFTHAYVSYMGMGFSAVYVFACFSTRYIKKRCS